SSRKLRARRRDRIHGRSLQDVSGILSVLSGGASPSNVPAAAPCRLDAGDRGDPRRDSHAQYVVARGCPVRRLWLRLGRALLFREEPSGDVQAPGIQPAGRLGDVPRRADGEASLLTRTFARAGWPGKDRTWMGNAGEAIGVYAPRSASTFRC